MRHTDILGEPNGHAGSAKGVGVSSSIVADRIVLGYLNQRRRQPAMVLGEQRRGVRVANGTQWVAEVMAAVRADSAAVRTVC